LEQNVAKKTFNVDEAQWDNEVLASDTPVLVDFWAEWCPPCKMIAPIVDEIANEYEGKLRVAKLDADANPDIVNQYEVLGMPTLLLFKHGEVVERVVGFKPKDKIMSKLVEHI
jgi:thioredoxin 1